MTDTNATLESQNKIPQGELIFALDIGTRSVIGVVGVKNGDIFKVLAIESMEHIKRAMIDGQIEDVEQVAKVAGFVKEK
ncbi:MAG: cell division protein FtsA, partial [Oscillospiraceae bacterium]